MIVFRCQQPPVEVKADNEFDLHRLIADALDGATDAYFASPEELDEWSDDDEAVAQALDPYGDTVIEALDTLTRTKIISGATISWE